VVSGLVGPHELARVDVEGDDRVRVQVHARAARVPRLRIARTEDREVELRIDEGVLPHRAAPVGRARAGLLRPRVATGLPRPWNGRPAPDAGAGRGIEGVHAVAGAAAVAAAVSDDEHAVEVHRRGRDAAALLPWHELRLPNLAPEHLVDRDDTAVTRR